LNTLPMVIFPTAAAVTTSPNPVLRGGELLIKITGTPGTYYPFLATPPALPIPLYENGMPVVVGSNGQGTGIWHILSTAGLTIYQLRVADSTGYTVAATSFSVVASLPPPPPPPPPPVPPPPPPVPPPEEGIPLEYLILGGVAAVVVGSAVVFGGGKR
jgi:hypothetical protein